MLQRVLDMIGRRPAISPEARDFTHHLLRDHDSDIGEAGAARLAEIATSAFEFMRDKPVPDAPVPHKVRWRHVGDGTGSPISGPPATLIEILNDDMPFLVDSVVGELQSRDIPIALVLHPIVRTLRHANGKLIRLTGAGDRNWRQGQESFIQLHLPLLTDDAATGVVTALSHVLSQVRTAVNDWPAMTDRLARAIDALKVRAPHVPAAETAEALAFLEWLNAGNFIFLGMRDFDYVGTTDAGDLQQRPGSELGVLRDPGTLVLRRGTEQEPMGPEVRRFLQQPVQLFVSKANSLSAVHRRAPMDYVGIKQIGMGGQLAGELRVVGLFTSTAYTANVRDIPLVRRKVAQVFDKSGLPPDSHSGKALANVLATFPRDDLFQISELELARWASAIQDLETRPRVRVFTRVDVFDRFVSALVYLPRDRFSSQVRLRIGEAIAQAYASTVTDFTPVFLSFPMVRVQYVLRRNDAPRPPVDPRGLEATVAELTRTWDDKLAAHLDAEPVPGATSAQGAAAERALRLARYAGAFPADYQSGVDPARAVEDLKRIEPLNSGRPISVDFYREHSGTPGRVKVAIYRLGEPIPLSDRVPLMESFGFRVIDERTFELMPIIDGTRQTVRVHEMALQTVDGQALPEGDVDQRLEETCLQVWREQTSNDAFNGLVRLAGFQWHEAALFRAYARYLRQAGAPFTQGSIAAALNRNVAIAKDLHALFLARFKPGPAEREERQRLGAAIKARLEAALGTVASLEEDRILRLLLQLIEATKRTNVFIPDAPAIAFKIASAELDILPQPRPFAEIWVYSVAVEGVHLRFAPIARGGIRWSDRAQDFRTEVLGLVKAQQVKNTVIVPSGAKGGFFPKQLPAKGTRDAIQKEAIRAYKLFIGALLDLTDNLADGRVLPPKDVVRHDGDDPYLVVAADKGTASFSDIANGIATERGFWLGDAFASGGSAGYDHKKMAITARGGWECVKRHFREMDMDVQTTPFRAVGVGDMSGDVFGNAMLLSEETQLVAAFDHRDIFIDPVPDAIASLDERKRMFALPRSSWADYDVTKLSTGGGVFSRSLKAVPLSPEARDLLGIAVAAPTPDEVVRAILKAPVDLLWFGGIGTFVKARAEPHEAAGDRANDGTRVDAEDLRARVIGEGANLAVTQRARIAYAQAGGRLNTDFIDNSAGVNSSDLEVNIKITTGTAIASGRLGAGDRNVLLAAMTPDVAASCLRNNYQQSLALSLEERGGAPDLPEQQRLVRALEGRGVLDRKLELLPSEAEFSDRRQANQGLTRPELAVLMSFAKIDLTRAILASNLPDDPIAAPLLQRYFPPLLVERLPDDVAQHRLRREIIATALTNSTINRLGAAGVARLAEEGNATIVDVARAFMVARAVLGLDELWAQLDGLDSRITGAQQLDLYARVRAVLSERTAWFMTYGHEATTALVERYRGGLLGFAADWDRIVPPRVAESIMATASALAVAGVPADVAVDVARLETLARSGDAINVQATTGRPLVDVGAALASVGEAFRLDELAAAAERIRPQDRYDRLALDGALGSLARTRGAIAERVLRAAGASSDAINWPVWASQQGTRVADIRHRIDRILDEGSLTVGRVTVADAALRDLL